MKKNKIIYWITTSIVALMGLVAGVMYFTNPMMVDEFKHLGFPDYFRVELGTAKLLGAFALILPMVPNRIKEWTYAGFAIVFISASITHIKVEGIAEAISPLISLVLLSVSYVYYTKLSNRKKITA